MVGGLIVVARRLFGEEYCNWMWLLRVRWKSSLVCFVSR